MGSRSSPVVRRRVPAEVWDGRGVRRIDAAAALGRCARRAVVLVARGRIHQPGARRHRCCRFADGTAAAVYRETLHDRPPPRDPAVLVVAFRLRAVHGRLGHGLFRRESVLNTVLFAGFPGFVRKLWLRHDEQGRYRGLYEWDGAAAALAYVGALVRILGPVSAPGTVRAVVLPGLGLDALLADPAAVEIDGSGRDPAGAWWRLVDIEGLDQ